jgi:Holliday junction resolvase RusA-like endonuclease
VPTREYTFAVEGAPKPKERPRMARNGRVYTPKRTLDYEQEIAAAYRGPMYEGPVCVQIDYEPNCQTITVYEADHDSKMRSDIDNLVKATADGLQRGGAFANDRQIVDLWAAKH